MQIMEQVDFLDLVSVVVLRGQGSPIDPCPVLIQFEPLDETKNVVFDPDALRIMNQQVSDRIGSMKLKWSDPNARQYLEEFVGRLVAELYKNGLVALDDAKEGPDDPYQHVRKTPARKN